MLLSSLIFEWWRVNSRHPDSIPWVNLGQDTGCTAIWRCLEFWSLEEALGAGGQVGEMGQTLKWRASQAVKRKLGVELIEAASAFPAMSHTNHETTWNISPAHKSPLSFTSSLFFVVIFLFCCLSSHTLHWSPASLSPIPILVSFRCWAYLTFCRPFTSRKCCKQCFWA